MIICFFIFKQKTAYEMRISDWSSGVCSSDLTRPDSAVEPDTYPLHVELQVPRGTPLESPFAGVVHKAADGMLQLDSLQLSIRLWGVTSPLHSGAALVKGQVLGEVDGPLRVQLCRGVQLKPPLFCTPSRAPA